MSRTVSGVFLVAAFGLVMTACSNEPKNTTVDPNLFPKDYQNEILSAVINKVEDPINIRDAGITEPALRVASHEQRYTVCVRYNARSFGGQYTGVKESIAYFYGGTLNQLLDVNAGQCAGAPYRPWPQLETYCVAGRCPSRN